MAVKMFLNKIKNEHSREVLSGSIQTFLMKIIGLGLGFLTSYILANQYGAAAIGTVAIITSIVSIAVILSTLGLNVSILKFIPERLSLGRKNDCVSIYKKSTNIVLVTSSIIGILLFTFSKEISVKIYDNEELMIWMKIGSLFIIFSALFSINAITLRAFKNIRHFNLLEILKSVFNLSLAILLTLFFFDEKNPIYIYFSTIFIGFVLSIYWVIREFKKSVCCSDDLPQEEVVTYSNLFRVSFPMFLTGAMSMVMAQLDTMMIAFFLNAESVGVYSIVVKLTSLIMFPVGVVNVILAPKITELYSTNNMQSLKIVTKSSARVICMLATPFALILIFFSNKILSVFGEEFTAGELTLSISAFGYAVVSLFGSVAFFMNMTGNEKLYFKITLFSFLINITLNYFLIPMYGISGAAFSTSLSMVILTVLPALYIKKRFNFSIGVL